MAVIIVLVGASLLVAIGFLIAYLWAVKSGQYDDKYTPSVRVLFENKKKEDRNKKPEKSSKKPEDGNNNKKEERSE